MRTRLTHRLKHLAANAVRRWAISSLATPAVLAVLAVVLAYLLGRHPRRLGPALDALVAGVRSAVDIVSQADTGRPAAAGPDLIGRQPLGVRACRAMARLISPNQPRAGYSADLVVTHKNGDTPDSAAPFHPSAPPVSQASPAAEHHTGPVNR